jgi:glucose uptake protein GlcU
MIEFIGYVLPCIILSYIFLKKRKAYSLVLLMFFVLDLLNVFVLDNLSNIEQTIMYIIAIPLLIIGIILFYKDYKKNKN